MEIIFNTMGNQLVNELRKSGFTPNKIMKNGVEVHKMYKNGEVVYGQELDVNGVHFILAAGSTVTLPSGSFEYSYDESNWSAATASQVMNQSFYLRGKNSRVGQFSSTGNFSMSGNAMSLINYETLPDTVPEEGFYGTFSGCTGLTSVSENFLPATTLASYCYIRMFGGCTSLTTAPALPATTLAYGCYTFMFQGCTALTTAPALPAIVLSKDCYYAMFRGCTSLTTAPELPATNPESNCYVNMFYGCTSLSSITCSLYSVGDSITTNWVYNVASTGEFHCYNFVTWETGVSGIPSGWTRINI